MIVRSLQAKQFYARLTNPQCIYTSQDFTALNAPKVQAVRYFAAIDDKGAPRLGLVAGYRNGQWLAPFSAPYSILSWHRQPNPEEIYDFLAELTEELQGMPLRLTLPPRFALPQVHDCITAVATNMARQTIIDYNYHIPLNTGSPYTDTITPEAGRHLRRAQAQPFEFSPTTDINRVYGLIEAHHQALGYHMAMSLDDVVATAAVVPSDFFILTLDGADVAAAYVQHPFPGVAQLINWGDVRSYASLRPMNLLVERLCDHYAALGFSAFDMGPASTAGIPNTGLCRFKRSVGGTLSLKPTFIFR